METRGAIWLVAGSLVAFKVWATALLFVYEPTRRAALLVLATAWPWLVLGLLLIAAPTFAWYRLVRVRARRERLRRAEWMLDAMPPAPARLAPRPTPSVPAGAARSHASRARRPAADAPPHQWPVWVSGGSDGDS